MFTGQREANAISIFKWKWRTESSLTTGLLNDVPPEIELFNYNTAPSPGSESPSGLLNGESLNVEPIADLDLFFVRLYSYYYEKGLWCIVVKWIVELLSLGFTISFSGFFLLFVDWNGLLNAKCGTDAVESPYKQCDLYKEALNRHPFTPFTLSKAVIVGYLGFFSIYSIFCLLRFFAQLTDTLKIRNFYFNSLNITDNDMQTMPWASILEKIVLLQHSQKICIVKDLTAHDIVMRLMRKENYLIGMINKGVLSFPISKWVPGAGQPVKSGLTGVERRLILTKTLEWTLSWCILQSMFDRNFCIQRDFISDPKTLKKRLMVIGFAMLVLSPFLVIFMLVYVLLRYAEQLYNHPSTALSQRWSNLSKWLFREFNEVDHLFKHRMSSGAIHASAYLKQFPSPTLSIISKFISFVCGGFAAVLIIIAFLEESLLEGHIFGRNLIWYSAVFGTIIAICRASAADDHLVLDPQEAMSQVFQHIHYMPKRWRGNENSETVRMEFVTLFQYTLMTLLEDVASIFVTPYLLIFVVPKQVEDILQFITDFTVDVEGVGHVCSFRVFDFQRHGSLKYGSTHNSLPTMRSSQGKMEKSFLSFKNSYPSWEPNTRGKQYFSKLEAFREQKLIGQVRIPTDLPPRLQLYSPNQRRLDLRGQGDLSNFFSRETLQNIPERVYQQSTNSNHKNNLYILDRYYTSQPYTSTKAPLNVPSRFSDAAEGSLKNFLMSPNKPYDEATNNEYWKKLFDDRPHRLMEASTSTSLFPEGVLHHNDSVKTPFHQPNKSHWWDRGDARGWNAQDSFMEPPTFNCNTDYRYDNLSDRSITEEDEHLDLRRFNKLSRTFYMDDSEGGQFNLPFGDIYMSSEPDPSDLV